jgi:hypothetical protein
MAGRIRLDGRENCTPRFKEPGMDPPVRHAVTTETRPGIAVTHVVDGGIEWRGRP